MSSFAPVSVRSATSSTSAAAATEVLLVHASADVPPWTRILRASYRVATTSNLDVAKQFVSRHPPSLIVTELERPEGDGIDVCREAKALGVQPSVLVVTAHPERVPDALLAGCDGVLLKPFAPNLLLARIGRLLRLRSDARREHGGDDRLNVTHAAEQSAHPPEGTNRVWPNATCPHCNHNGIVGFEFCSHRRAWYACVDCRNVWIAKRLE